MDPSASKCGFTTLGAVISEASAKAMNVTAAHDESLFDIPLVVLPKCTMAGMWGGLGYCRI